MQGSRRIAPRGSLHSILSTLTCGSSAARSSRGRRGPESAPVRRSADFARGGGHIMKLGDDLQAPNLGQRPANLPVEQKSELRQHSNLVLEHGGVSVPSVLHDEGKGLRLVVPASGDENAALAAGDLVGWDGSPSPPRRPTREFSHVHANAPMSQPRRPASDGRPSERLPFPTLVPIWITFESETTTIRLTVLAPGAITGIGRTSIPVCGHGFAHAMLGNQTPRHLAGSAS